MLDLFVALRDRANALFRNDGARFIDVATTVGLADTRRTVGAVWFDHDEDGDLDVITGNMDGDANGLFSYSDGRFTDVADVVGVAWGGRTPNDKTNGTVRPCVADVNSDGRLDLFFANYGKNGLFLNRGKGKFEDVSTVWAIDIDARYDTCAFGDMDNDWRSGPLRQRHRDRRPAIPRLPVPQHRKGFRGCDTTRDWLAPQRSRRAMGRPRSGWRPGSRPDRRPEGGHALASQEHARRDAAGSSVPGESRGRRTDARPFQRPK